jgi:hypothetical protein
MEFCSQSERVANTKNRTGIRLRLFVSRLLADSAFGLAVRLAVAVRTDAQVGLPVDNGITIFVAILSFRDRFDGTLVGANLLDIPPSGRNTLDTVKFRVTT